ncbi:MAG: DUF3794 domain-containing protein [Clostridia bacterium]|nr:DUF3794 domain-containing protein [Clostridia bacterium]
MALEPKFEKLASGYKLKLGELQSSLSNKLPIPEEENIANILCANVKANVTNVEISQGVVNLNGVASIQILYTLDTGENRAMDFSVEFKDRLTVADTKGLVDCVVDVDVVDTKARVIDKNIAVEAILNISFTGIINDTINVLTETIGEDVYTKYEDLSYSEYLGVANEKFEESFDVQINDAVLNVLSVCPQVRVEKVELFDNYLKVFGEVSINVLYNASGDIAKVRSYNTIMDFNQEVALSGIVSSSSVFSSISTMYSNINVTTNLGDDKTVINIVVPIEYKGYVWNTKTLQVVSDVYSLSNYINVNIDSFDVQNNYAPQIYRDRFSGMVTLEENDLIVDEVLGNCCPSILLVNKRFVGDSLIVDGIVTTSLIYRNSDTAMSSLSYEVQVPFSLDFRIMDLPEGVDADVELFVQDLVIKVRRGTDIEVSGSISAFVTYYNLIKEAAINSITLGEVKPIDDCNLLIYFVKAGDTIWSIAKELSVSEDLILEQNPSLELPLSAGKKIIVFKQKIANLNN